MQFPFQISDQAEYQEEQFPRKTTLRSWWQPRPPNHKTGFHGRGYQRTFRTKQEGNKHRTRKGMRIGADEKKRTNTNTELQFYAY